MDRQRWIGRHSPELDNLRQLASTWYGRFDHIPSQCTTLMLNKKRAFRIPRKALFRYLCRRTKRSSCVGLATAAGDDAQTAQDQRH